MTLRFHGDAEAAGNRAGLVDLAVNVRPDTPPEWLARIVAGVELASYPDATAATAAVATRHGRSAEDVLVTAGAAEAFVLIARALAPRRAVVVNPQFTEPEAALRAAGHDVQRVVLDWPYVLDPAVVPEDADLVVLGNPTNPTSVLHPAKSLLALAASGRTLVVDEAFIDCVPGEAESLARRRDPNVVVIRSLTKTWGLAGLRAGYLLGPADLITRLKDAQPLWAVSSPALAAIEACCQPRALAEAEAWANQLWDVRLDLAEALAKLDGVTVVPGAMASFLLVRTPKPVREALRAKGFAVRRGETFPGLDEHWIRVAVRDTETTDAFVNAVRDCL